MAAYVAVGGNYLTKRIDSDRPTAAAVADAVGLIDGPAKTTSFGASTSERTSGGDNFVDRCRARIRRFSDGTSYDRRLEAFVPLPQDTHLAKPSSNLLQRTGGDHRGGRARNLDEEHL